MAQETLVQIQNMVFDAFFLNTQHFKGWLKRKGKQLRERSNALPLHLGVVAIDKVAFRTPSTTVVNVTADLKSKIFLLLGW